MLYLVGGVYRTGKTTLARRVLAEKLVPFVSTDSLLHMLKNSAPSLGVTDKLPLKQKADKFFPFLEQFVKYALYSTPDYLIEGDAIWPEQAARLQKIYKVKAVFLGFSKIEAQGIAQYAGHNDWVSGMSSSELQNLADEIVRISSQLKDECQRFRLTYADLAGNYGAKFDRAFQYLVRE